MSSTMTIALALLAGLSIATVGVAATGMGGGLMGWDHMGMMDSADHGSMMSDHDHDHESMTEEECEEGYETHREYMESDEHCEG